MKTYLPHLTKKEPAKTHCWLPLVVEPLMPRYPKTRWLSKLHIFKNTTGIWWPFGNYGPAWLQWEKWGESSGSKMVPNETWSLCFAKKKSSKSLFSLRYFNWNSSKTSDWNLANTLRQIVGPCWSYEFYSGSEKKRFWLHPCRFS